MTKGTERLPINVRDGKTGPDPFENPLDFIAEDHMREREVCALIDKLVTASSTKSAERKMIVDFLTEQLPLHLADEEIDLFPLMLERCDPEEEIKELIEKLEADHGHALADASAIASLIEAKKTGDETFSATACSKMTEFASHARRHLVLENAIILPIARVRLTRDDLETMRDHMRERRLDHHKEKKK